MCRLHDGGNCDKCFESEGSSEGDCDGCEKRIETMNKDNKATVILHDNWRTQYSVDIKELTIDTKDQTIVLKGRWEL